jgi:hypothetical protein
MVLSKLSRKFKQFRSSFSNRKNSLFKRIKKKSPIYDTKISSQDKKRARILVLFIFALFLIFVFTSRVEALPSTLPKGSKPKDCFESLTKTRFGKVVRNNKVRHPERLIEHIPKSPSKNDIPIRKG